MSKDSDVAKVTAQLDELLDDLRANVDALNAILTRPVPPGGGEQDERLAAP